MIYTKNNGEKNPILDGNTFTICCKCGKEISVSLNELFKAKKNSPLSAEIICLTAIRCFNHVNALRETRFHFRVMCDGDDFEVGITLLYCFKSVTVCVNSV